MNSSTETNSQKTTSSSNTDDESITTSTESDSIGTWTLVNDKKKKNKADITSVKESTNNRIENLDNSEDSVFDENKDIHESTDSRTDDDSIVDDISEGISIISESESAGRASPLVISDSFSSADLKNYPNLDDISPTSMLRLPIHIPQPTYSLPSTSSILEEKSLRQRRVKRSSSSEQIQKITLSTKNECIENTRIVYPLVRRGLNGLFFVCATLSILAFIGKLRNPDWEPFSNINNLSVLEQKLTDLELQNNLMRAEIDILSKQVNYLSSINENVDKNWENVKREQKSRNFKQTGEWIMKQKGKSFKGEPVQTKNELKMENLEKFEDVVEGIQSPERESGGDSANKPNIHEHQKNKMDSNESEARFKNNNNHMKNERENYSKSKYEKQKRWTQKHKHVNDKDSGYDDDNDDDDNDDFSDEENDFDDSLEDFGKPKLNSKENYKKPEHKYKHRHHSDKSKNRSKERRFHVDSMENRYTGSAEQSHKSGEWHGNLMQQRENARRHNDFRDRNKNWFIERGDSREKKRHS